MKYEFYFKLQLTRRDDKPPVVWNVPGKVKIPLFPWTTYRGGYFVRGYMIYNDLIMM